MKINFHNIFTQFRHVTLNHVTISELKLRQELIYSNVNSKIDDSKYWLKDDNVNRIEFMPASHNLRLKYNFMNDLLNSKQKILIY